MLEILKEGSNGATNGSNGRRNGLNKVLNAPVHLGAMAATLEAQVEQIKSIWVTTRDDGMVIFHPFCLWQLPTFFRVTLYDIKFSESRCQEIRKS